MKKILIIFALLFSTTLHAQTYKLYQTDNIHNQLRLNSKTGEVIRFKTMDKDFLFMQLLHQEVKSLVGILSIRLRTCGPLFF